MIRAICISCGMPKSAAWKKCRVCGVDPNEDETILVKSVYLSEGRYEDEEEQKRYAKELDRLAEAIKNGEEVDYDPFELERLLSQKRTVESVPLKGVWGAVFRTFLPGVVLFSVLLTVYVLLRWLQPR